MGFLDWVDKDKKKKSVAEPDPVVIQGPDFEYCKVMFAKIMDVLYARSGTSTLEWDIAISLVQGYVLGIKSEMSIQDAIKKVSFIPVPVPIAMQTNEPIETEEDKADFHHFG